MYLFSLRFYLCCNTCRASVKGDSDPVVRRLRCFLSNLTPSPTRSPARGPQAFGVPSWVPPLLVAGVGPAVLPHVSPRRVSQPWLVLAVLSWTRACSVSTPIKDLSYSTLRLCSACLCCTAEDGAPRAQCRPAVILSAPRGARRGPSTAEPADSPEPPVTASRPRTSRAPHLPPHPADQLGPGHCQTGCQGQGDPSTGGYAISGATSGLGWVRGAAQLGPVPGLGSAVPTHPP